MRLECDNRCEVLEIKRVAQNGEQHLGVWDFIQVKEDCPGLNKDGMVPILDLKCKMEEHGEGDGRSLSQIVWIFYEKPM